MADFTWTDVCLGFDMFFNDNTNYSVDPLSGAANSWDWSFGDGGTSTLEDPSHFYAAVAVYPVTLTVTDSYGCIDSVTQDVEVWPLPAVAFTVAPVCITFPSFFDNSATPSPAAVVWDWDFGDGITVTDNTPDISHTYATVGTYTVTLTITDTNGCQETFTDLAVVQDEPQPDFSALDVCQGYTTQFNNTLIYCQFA